MKKLAVLFGGITVEHEVSVITAVQLMKHVDLNKFEVVPVYIDKNGQWWTGNQLKDVAYYKNQDLRRPSDLEKFSLDLNHGSNDIDVAILCFHGDYGESGKIQGLLEVAGIPYQGPEVTSSAVCFDKIFLRQIFSAEGIPQPKYVWFTLDQWQQNQSEVEAKVSQLEFPVFVKPANGGSTIGIQKVNQIKDLPKAIEEVAQYDPRILIEQAVTDCIEVNVSVLGDKQKSQASVPEQPINKDEFLSFADKYERGGGKKSGMASASRRIPAPISTSLTEKLQDLAQEIFKLLDCTGVIRIDFFVNPSTQEIYVIEPNTIPGSMSYYLWEASGVKYEQLVERLVEIALHQAQAKKEIITTFDSNILEKAKT